MGLTRTELANSNNGLANTKVVLTGSEQVALAQHGVRRSWARAGNLGDEFHRRRSDTILALFTKVSSRPLTRRSKVE